VLERAHGGSDQAERGRRPPSLFDRLELDDEIALEVAGTT